MALSDPLCFDSAGLSRHGPFKENNNDQKRPRQTPQPQKYVDFKLLGLKYVLCYMLGKFKVIFGIINKNIKCS